MRLGGMVIIHRSSILVVRRQPESGHSAIRHSSVSEDFPIKHDVVSLQARALTFNPLPQVAEHEDHSPQSCHSGSGPAHHLHRSYGFVSNQNMLVCKLCKFCLQKLPRHSDITQSAASVEFPSHVAIPPKAGLLQGLALTLVPLPHEEEH